jgi:hypothetical protein
LFNGLYFDLHLLDAPCPKFEFRLINSIFNINKKE